VTSAVVLRLAIVLALVAPRVGGAATVVRTVGCRTFVTTFIEISGAGASKAIARKIRSGIAACSPATVGGYSLGGCCKVIMRSKVRVRRRNRGPRPGYSQVDVTTEAGFRSYVQGDGGVWGSDEAPEIYAHEAAHLLGLDDEYVDSTLPDGTEVSIANEGHEMDKMATSGGKFGIGIAARDTLDQLLLRKGARCDTRKCCHETTTTNSSTTTSSTFPGLRYCCVDHCPLALGCVLRGECTAPTGQSCCTTDTSLFIQVGSCADLVPNCTGCQ
jgi:hypothetical protein